MGVQSRDVSVPWWLAAHSQTLRHRTPPPPAHAHALETSFDESYLSRKISLCQESTFFMRGAAGRLLEHTQTPVSTTPKFALKEAMPGVGGGEGVCVS